MTTAKEYRIIMTVCVEDNRVIRGMYEELNKELAYSDKEFTIRLPVSAKEIIREGHMLHHCVSNYVKSVTKGRKKPES